VFGETEGKGIRDKGGSGDEQNQLYRPCHRQRAGRTSGGGKRKEYYLRIKRGIARVRSFKKRKKNIFHRIPLPERERMLTLVGRHLRGY